MKQQLQHSVEAGRLELLICGWPWTQQIGIAGELVLIYVAAEATEELLEFHKLHAQIISPVDHLVDDRHLGEAEAFADFGIADCITRESGEAQHVDGRLKSEFAGGAV